MNLKRTKGQVSLEIIILIGVLLVVAIILAIIFFDFSDKSIQSTTDTIEGDSNVVDNFVKDYNAAVGVIYIYKNNTSLFN